MKRIVSVSLVSLAVLVLLVGGCSMLIKYKEKEIIRTEINPRGVKLALPELGVEQEFGVDLEWLLVKPRLTVEVE